MSYRESYFQFFAAITDALCCLQSGQVLQGMQILLRASAEGEAAYLEADILPDRPAE